MSRRKEPSIPNDILDQLLAGTDAAAALSQRKAHAPHDGSTTRQFGRRL